MGALEHSKIRAHCLRFDFLPNQLGLIKAPVSEKKSVNEPCAVAAPKGDRDLTPPPPEGTFVPFAAANDASGGRFSGTAQDRDPVPDGLLYLISRFCERLPE